MIRFDIEQFISINELAGGGGPLDLTDSNRVEGRRLSVRFLAVTVALEVKMSV